jgi:hypothetical protein
MPNLIKDVESSAILEETRKSEQIQWPQFEITYKLSKANFIDGELKWYNHLLLRSLLLYGSIFCQLLGLCSVKSLNGFK